MTLAEFKKWCKEQCPGIGCTARNGMKEYPGRYKWKELMEKCGKKI